jgi:two-component system, NtrC family, sensor histidine kinase HydH
LTIRKTLMIAFLLASLVPSALLAMLAFESASASMHAEIERSLQVGAATVSLDIDKMLFERLQNAQTWSRLDVMQDIQIKDVDKRLATFLHDAKAGYSDVYAELLVTDTDGRIVASSNSADIGQPRPVATSVPFFAHGYDAIRMEPLEWTDTPDRALLPLTVDIASNFGDQKLGKLVLLFNWAQIYNILDQAGQDGRRVVVADSSGQVIAASSALRANGVLTTRIPKDWTNAGRSGTTSRDGSPLQLDQLSIGYDRSRGFQYFPGFEWTTLMLQPSHEAFAPIRTMALVFVALLVLTSTGAIGFSFFIAGRIARPITHLTRFTREFRHSQPLPVLPTPTGGREVGELTEAFVTTMLALEKSRSDLVRASTLAALGELSAVVAHEIRTPIGILRSSAQMLAREPQLSDEGRELAGFIQSESERLNGLVSTLLESTRKRVPSPQPTRLTELIRVNLAMLSKRADERGIRLVDQLPDELPRVNCDPEQMTQVFLNVLQNALQHVPRGGQVRVSGHASASHVGIAIADDGPGIAAAVLPHIFEPFFSQREGGFGLGLAAVQQIIIAHAGSIAAERSDLGGALFTITLPLPADNP